MLTHVWFYFLFGEGLSDQGRERGGNSKERVRERGGGGPAHLCGRERYEVRASQTGTVLCEYTGARQKQRAEAKTKKKQKTRRKTTKRSGDDGIDGE